VLLDVDAGDKRNLKITFVFKKRTICTFFKAYRVHGVHAVVFNWALFGAFFQRSEKVPKFSKATEMAKHFASRNELENHVQIAIVLQILIRDF
jgi:hypothetical protein